MRSLCCRRIEGFRTVLGVLVRRTLLGIVACVTSKEKETRISTTGSFRSLLERIDLGAFGSKFDVRSLGNSVRSILVLPSCYGPLIHGPLTSLGGRGPVGDLCSRMIIEHIGSR